MFERFTDRARRVVVLAQEEARLLDHNYIGTEHLLLGMIHEGDGVAAMALLSLGVSLAGSRAEVLALIGHGDQPPQGNIPFTPRAKKVLELSLREALQLGHNYIGTEHILLGLLREGEGVASQILVKQGVGLEAARSAVLQLMSGMPLDDLGTRSFGDPQGSGGTFVGTVPRASGRPAPGHGPGLNLPVGGRRCSFCLKEESHVGRIVRSRGVSICDECLGRAQALVAAAKPGDPKRLRLRPPLLPEVQTPEAEEAVELAFETVFGGDASTERRLDFVEDSANVESVMRAMMVATRVSGDPDIWVERVRFLAEDQAAVSFLVLIGGPGLPMQGIAVLEQGTWKVSRHTFLAIAGLAGVAIPPEEPA